MTRRSRSGDSTAQAAHVALRHQPGCELTSSPGNSPPSSLLPTSCPGSAVMGGRSPQAQPRDSPSSEAGTREGMFVSCSIGGGIPVSKRRDLTQPCFASPEHQLHM